MKTILLLLTAWATGNCFAFFTYNDPADNPASCFFEFDNIHYAPTLFNVQDESKWIPVPSMGACNNERVKACRIEVSREYVRGNTLLPTATITAQEYCHDTAFVTGGFIIQFVNKK